MKFDPECVHWWIIDEQLVGRCKKCGAVKDFEKLREELKTHFARGKETNDKSSD